MTWISPTTQSMHLFNSIPAGVDSNGGKVVRRKVNRLRVGRKREKDGENKEGKKKETKVREHREKTSDQMTTK